MRLESLFGSGIGTEDRPCVRSRAAPPIYAYRSEASRDWSKTDTLLRKIVMADSQAQTLNTQSERIESFDAIVIGAGVAGLYQIYRLRELGLSVRGLEDGGGVGGTWYWNRYPGCRFDSESETYGYSFSKELLQEWDWKEHFSGQPENERYLNYVADRFDLRRHIQFNSHVIFRGVRRTRQPMGGPARERTTHARAIPGRRGG